MTFKLLTEQHLEFLSLKGGCRGSSEVTLVEMPHCWKSHDAAHMALKIKFFLPPFLLISPYVTIHFFLAAGHVDISYFLANRSILLPPLEK